MTIKTRHYIFFLVVFTAVLGGCNKSPFTDTNGKAVEFSNKKEQWTVLNVWADWCDPCRDEIPELNALSDAGTIKVIGMDFDGSEGDELKRKVEELEISFPVLQQSPIVALKVKAPQVLPASYLINSRGEVVDTLFGPQTKNSLELQIKKLREKKVDD